MPAGDPITSPEELYRRLEAGTATERGPWMGHGYRKEAIGGQDIYDRFIAPDERRRIRELMAGQRQQRGMSQALAEGERRAAAARGGFANTALEAAMKGTFESAWAKNQALGAADRQRQLLAMQADPARFDVLRQAAEAASRRLQRDAVGNQVWAGIDQSLAAAMQGTPLAGLGAAIGAIGAGRSAHGAGIIGHQGADAAQRFSPGSIDAIDLGALARSIGRGSRGQQAPGFQGAAPTQGSAWRRALEDEYGGYG